MARLRNHLALRLGADTGRVARLAVAVLAVLLLLLNFGGWATLHKSWRTQQQLVEDGLVANAGLIAGAIPPDSLFFLSAAYDHLQERTDFDILRQYAELPSARALQRSIAETAARREYLDVAILSTTGEMVLDDLVIYTTPTLDLWSGEDAVLIAGAARGETRSSSPLAPTSIRRIYHPLRDDQDTIIGVLRLASDQRDALAISHLVKRLTMATLLTTILVLFLWWTLTRLIRRAIAAERMAHQSDRLRALGTATAGIAHEIRNPLGIVTLLVEELAVMAKGVPDGQTRDRLQQTLRDLKDETKRLRELTDQFLNFTRDKPGTMPHAHIELADAAARSVSLFQKGAPPQITVEFHPPAEPLWILFGETRLRQVLLNVLRNAQEALDPRGGRIAVRIAREKDEAVLEISDDGPGMDAATLAQVFDPFFTTRSEGTGLGLSLSKSLVEAAGGQFTMHSEKGMGTRARLTFPLARNK